MASSHEHMKGTVLLTIGAAFSGLLAGFFSTLLFLWIYGFDNYRSAFYNRSLPVLSMNFKYIFLGISSLIWFAIFSKWVFRRSGQPV